MSTPGAMVIADIGQDAVEEVDFARELRTVSLPAGNDDRPLNLTVPAIPSFRRGQRGPRVRRVPAACSPCPSTSPLARPMGRTIKIAGVPGGTFLDISGDVATGDLERGLLSMVFAPDYATSGRFYVYYADPAGDIRVEEFRRSASDPNAVDPASRRLALGDGGGSGDPLGNAQNLGSLLGKILRIDP